MNIVLIRHQKDPSKQYLFQLPGDVELKQGDHVACNTMHGTQEGWCCCNSFHAEGMTLTAVAQAHGATFPLKPVIGRYENRLVKFEDDCGCKYDELMQKYTAKCKAYDELKKVYDLATKNTILATTKLLNFAKSNAEAANDEIERLRFDYVECRDAHDRLHDYCRDLEEEYDKLKAQLKQIRDFVERENKNETV